MESNTPELEKIIEAALLAAGRPLSTQDLLGLFPDDARPEAGELESAIEALGAQCESRPIELIKVASGYRLQVRADYSVWVSRLWEERAPRYSRALMETLSIIAYRQPVTRGDIEDVRGVAVSSNIIRTLQERRWVKVVGNRDVPGRPALYGTTREFLDYFSLNRLSELPPLDELRDLDEINVELDFGAPADDSGQSGEAVAPGAAPDAADSSDGTGTADAEGSNDQDAVGDARPALATVTQLHPQRRGSSGAAEGGENPIPAGADTGTDTGPELTTDPEVADSGDCGADRSADPQSRAAHDDIERQEGADDEPTPSR
jgi:segregation and condensation protein B